MNDKNLQSISEAKKQFEQILDDAKNDPNILALWLSGSRGKGVIVTEYSDYDCDLIVSEGVFKEYKSKYESIGNPDLEIFVRTLPIFKKYAEWGSDTSWDRYSFAHIKPLVDKTGEIQQLFDNKSIVPKDKVKEFVSGAIDAYVNELYRSLKCFRDGNSVGSQLEGSESVPWLLMAVFGMEGRLKPYYKYLEWELKTYPLSKLPWAVDDFFKKIIAISTSADIKTQKEVLRSMEPVFKSSGFGEVLDGWKEKIKWMKD
jgi:hypothetical protein